MGTRIEIEVDRLEAALDAHTLQRVIEAAERELSRTLGATGPVALERLEVLLLAGEDAEACGRRLAEAIVAGIRG